MFFFVISVDASQSHLSGARECSSHRLSRLSLKHEGTNYTNAAQATTIPSFRHVGKVPTFDWTKCDGQAVVYLALSCKGATGLSDNSLQDCELPSIKTIVFLLASCPSIGGPSTYAGLLQTVCGKERGLCARRQKVSGFFVTTA